MKTISTLLLCIGGALVAVPALCLFKEWVTGNEMTESLSLMLGVTNFVGLGIATIGMILEIYRTRRHQEAVLKNINSIMSDTNECMKFLTELRKAERESRNESKDAAVQ